MEANNVDIIYMDFRKAFDMVSQYRLFEKIKKPGVFLRKKK